MNKSRLLLPAFLSFALCAVAPVLSNAEPSGRGADMNGPCVNAPCDPCMNGGFHHGGDRGHHHGAWRGMPSMTPEQQAKAHAIAQEFGKKFRDIDAQIFIKHEELRALQHTRDVDVKAVRDVATELATLKNQKQDLRDELGMRLEKECGIPMPPFGGCPGFEGGRMHGGDMMMHGGDRGMPFRGDCPGFEGDMMRGGDRGMPR